MVFAQKYKNFFILLNHEKDSGVCIIHVLQNYALSGSGHPLIHLVWCLRFLSFLCAPYCVRNSPPLPFASSTFHLPRSSNKCPRCPITRFSEDCNSKSKPSKDLLSRITSDQEFRSSESNIFASSSSVFWLVRQLVFLLFWF